MKFLFICSVLLCSEISSCFLLSPNIQHIDHQSHYRTLHSTMAYFLVKDTTVSTITTASHTAFVIDEIYDSQYSPALTGGEGVDLDSYITFTTTSTLSSNATTSVGGISTVTPTSTSSTSSSSSSVAFNSSSASYTNSTASPGSSAVASTLQPTAVTSSEFSCYPTLSILEVM